MGLDAEVAVLQPGAAREPRSFTTVFRAPSRRRFLSLHRRAHVREHLELVHARSMERAVLAIWLCWRPRENSRAARADFFVVVRLSLSGHKSDLGR